MDQNILNRFEFFLDLGIIAVPNNFNQGTCLRDVSNCQVIGNLKVDNFINDSNFSNPSRVVVPGEQFRVCLFGQIKTGTIGSTTTTDERMSYLSMYENIVFLGAQGLALTIRQKWADLPKGFVCMSLDDKDHLWFDGQDHKIPYVFHYKNGDFGFNILNYRDLWFTHHLFFGFFEIK